MVSLAPAVVNGGSTKGIVVSRPSDIVVGKDIEKEELVAKQFYKMVCAHWNSLFICFA